MIKREKLSDLPPFCVRFRKGDLKYIRSAAKDMELSVWIRLVVLDRAQRILQGMKMSPLFYETAHGNGNSKCIRFTPTDHARVKAAAQKEGANPASWVRAIIMDRAKCPPQITTMSLAGALR